MKVDVASLIVVVNYDVLLFVILTLDMSYQACNIVTRKPS